MISTFCGKSLGSFDPWVIPHSSNVESFGATMPLSPVELSYSVIQTTYESANTDSKILLDEEPDPFSSPYWVTPEHLKDDFLNFIFPYDEAIMEVMSLQDNPGKTITIDPLSFPIKRGKKHIFKPSFLLTPNTHPRYLPCHILLHQKETWEIFIRLSQLIF
jgi:hypothetical protein